MENFAETHFCSNQKPKGRYIYDRHERFMDKKPTGCFKLNPLKLAKNGSSSRFWDKSPEISHTCYMHPCRPVFTDGVFFFFFPSDSSLFLVSGVETGDLHERFMGKRFIFRVG